jgi:uncharacterized protein (TIGR02996 family)
MSSHQALLADILENPQADEPRLRYANWLDQSCDPRGEFIRVQCRLARPDEYDPWLGELELRERELLGEFEVAWMEPIAHMIDGWAFHRGFANEVVMSGAKFLEHGPALCRLTPVEEIHFHKVGDRLAGLMASPALGYLRFVDLSGNRLGDSGLALLAQAPCLKGARGINLSSTGAGNAAAHAFALSPDLRNVEELYLSANNIGDDGAFALANSPHLEGIRTLFMNFNCLGLAGVQALRQRFGTRVHF